MVGQRMIWQAAEKPLQLTNGDFFIPCMTQASASQSVASVAAIAREPPSVSCFWPSRLQYCSRAVVVAIVGSAVVMAGAGVVLSEAFVVSFASGLVFAATPLARATVKVPS